MPIYFPNKFSVAVGKYVFLYHVAINLKIENFVLEMCFLKPN